MSQASKGWSEQHTFTQYCIKRNNVTHLKDHKYIPNTQNTPASYKLRILNMAFMPWVQNDSVCSSHHTAMQYKYSIHPSKKPGLHSGELDDYHTNANIVASTMSRHPVWRTTRQSYHASGHKKAISSYVEHKGSVSFNFEWSKQVNMINGTNMVSHSVKRGQYHFVFRYEQC